MTKYALTETIENILGHPVPERGQNAMVRCPFHGDTRPSLSIDLDRGLWVCFACGERGGIFKLARKMEAEVDETDVTIRALEAAAASPYFEEPKDFSDLAQSYHRSAFEVRPEGLIAYVAGRGLDPRVVKHFKLGWDARNQRISMPYFDDDRVVMVKYRSLDGSKTAEKGSRRAIYNINDVRGKSVVILCEGESDTHRMWSEVQKVDCADRIGVGGVPGVSITRSQWELWSLDLMWAERVYIAFDADSAGDKGAETVMALLGDKARRLRPTRGKDVVDHFVKGGSLAELGLDEADLPVPVA